MAETISIRIPASPEYLHVVRLVAASLAARLAFTIEDIDDLKIAVDELSAYLTGTQGRDGVLQVSFNLHGNKIEINGVGDYEGTYKVRTDLTDFSRMILETVADQASLLLQDGLPTFKIVKVASAL